MPPQNILNAPTKLMKDIGYGKGYAYDHDRAEGYSGADYWPEDMAPQTFYTPTDRGMEKRIAERMAWWREMKERGTRSEEHTSELQSLMRISYAVFCLKKK